MMAVRRRPGFTYFLYFCDFFYFFNLPGVSPTRTRKEMVDGVGFGVWGLGFKVWGLGFRVWGLGFRVWGSACTQTYRHGFGCRLKGLV